MTNPPSAYGRASVPMSMSGPAQQPEPLGPPPPRRSRWRGRVLAVVVFAAVIAAAAYIFVGPDRNKADAGATSGPGAITGAPLSIDATDSGVTGSGVPGSSGASASSASRSASARPTVAPPPPGRSPLVPDTVPMPKGDKPGWKMTFSDDFNGSQVSSSKWKVYSGEPGTNAYSYFEKSHVAEKNGMLVITASRTSTPDQATYATGGMQTRMSQKYGDYQVRFRADAGYGIPYAILLWPADDTSPYEVDFAEDNGKGRTMTSETQHYGSSNTIIHNETSGDFSKWHTAELIWSPGKLQFLIDGKVWQTLSNSNVPSLDMVLAIQMETYGCGKNWESCPNAGTPSKVNLDVDWVVVYAAD